MNTTNTINNNISINRKLYAYKFNKESNKSLEDLSDSKVYKLWKKAESENLTKEEYLWLTEKINQNTFFKNGSIPLLGWAFDFGPICHEYWCKIYLDSDEEDYYETELRTLIAPNEESAFEYFKSLDYGVIEIYQSQREL